MLFDDNPFLTFRYFTTIDTKNELDNVLKNPFLKPLDYVMVRETGEVFVAYDYPGNDETGDLLYFECLSKSMWREAPIFYHTFRVGNSFKVETGEELTIQDILFSINDNKAYYRYDLGETKNLVAPIIDLEMSYLPPTQTSFISILNSQGK